MKRLPPVLLALSPGDLRDERAIGGFLAQVESALGAGLEGILLREPELADRDCLRLASELRVRLDRLVEHAGWLGVHDRLHIALSARADAVHLGYRSLPLARVVELAGETLTVGLSTHAADDASKWQAADYLFHGPVRETPSKAGLLEPIGIAGLERAHARTDRPIWALGGLRTEDVRGVLATGVRGVAVLSGVLGSRQPAAATRAFLTELARD